MFSSLEESPEFGYSSVITSTEDLVERSCYDACQQYSKHTSPVFETSENHSFEKQLNATEPFPQLGADYSTNYWYSPQQFVSSSTCPYFKNTLPHQPTHNTYTEPNYKFAGDVDNYVPNSYPSLVELMQDIPLTPSVMTTPQTPTTQGNNQYRVHVSHNFRPIHNIQKKNINKNKRLRTAFTTEQLQKLEAVFAKQLYVSKSERQSLTKHLGITDRAIKVWFQNRRMKGKKDAQESYESSSVDSSTGDVLENIEFEVQKCEVVNDYVSVPTDICDKLGQLINEFVPKEFIDSHIQEINSSLETSLVSSNSSVNSTSTCDVQDNSLNSDATEEIQIVPSEQNYYVIDNSNNLKYEPISPAEGDPIEMPMWKPEEMKSLFDKHFC